MKSKIPDHCKGCVLVCKHYQQNGKITAWCPKFSSHCIKKVGHCINVGGKEYGNSDK